MKNLLSYSNWPITKDLDIEPAKASYEMYEIDGKTYAQPYRTDFWVLYYNKNV